MRRHFKVRKLWSLEYLSERITQTKDSSYINYLCCELWSGNWEELYFYRLLWGLWNMNNIVSSWGVTLCTMDPRSSQDDLISSNNENESLDSHSKQTMERFSIQLGSYWNIKDKHHLFDFWCIFFVREFYDFGNTLIKMVKLVKRCSVEYSHHHYMLGNILLYLLYPVPR